MEGGGRENDDQEEQGDPANHWDRVEEEVWLVYKTFDGFGFGLGKFGGFGFRVPVVRAGEEGCWEILPGFG